MFGRLGLRWQQKRYWLDGFLRFAAEQDRLSADDLDDVLVRKAKEYEIIKIVVPTVFTILLLIGLAANSLVVYVTIATNRAAKHPIHSIFVLNLAVADVLFLIVSGPGLVEPLTDDDGAGGCAGRNICHLCVVELAPDAGLHGSAMPGLPRWSDRAGTGWQPHRTGHRA